MSTAKPDIDTGWSKGWPKVTGYYWRRINEHDHPSLVRIVGDTCRFSDGSSEGRYECYEFTGPLSPSDFEQLIRLRKACEAAEQRLANNERWWSEAQIDSFIPDGHKQAFAARAQITGETLKTIRETLAQRPTGEQS